MKPRTGRCGSARTAGGCRACATGGSSPFTPTAPWLSELFLRATGLKLGPFLRTQQVFRARRLLRWPTLPLPAVARGSGYERERTFYLAFRRVTGTTPLRFREDALAVRHRPCRCLMLG
jgi:methylphosphotriester-DNA--protein-cysteine methyltransferase